MAQMPPDTLIKIKDAVQLAENTITCYKPASMRQKPQKKT